MYQGEAEKVSNSNITLLNGSNLTSPTLTYPAYTLQGAFITIFPAQFNGATDIEAQYIRYPKDPNWTYLNVANGEPAFNQSNADYQDFELPEIIIGLSKAGCNFNKISATFTLDDSIFKMNWIIQVIGMKEQRQSIP